MVCDLGPLTFIMLGKSLNLTGEMGTVKSFPQSLRTLCKARDRGCGVLRAPWELKEPVLPP